MLFWRNKNRLYTEPREKAHRVQYGGKGAYESARDLNPPKRENNRLNKDEKGGGLNFMFCYFLTHVRKVWALRKGRNLKTKKACGCCFGGLVFFFVNPARTNQVKS